MIPAHSPAAAIAGLVLGLASVTLALILLHWISE